MEDHRGKFNHILTKIPLPGCDVTNLSFKRAFIENLDFNVVEYVAADNGRYVTLLAELMSCEYWKDVITQLHDPSRCNWASHVLSTCLPAESNLQQTNLGAALQCVPSGKVIEGVISV